MRILSVLILGIFLMGCSKKSAPIPPVATLLVFPDNNSECTTGVSLNETTSQVEFRWQAADNAETYELRVTHSNTGTTQTILTQSLSAQLPIEKGALYSWVVQSRNSQVNDVISSETWRFYNSGFQTTYAPFPAEIIGPKLGESAFKDANNDVTLQWSGADIEEDITGYEVYFSTETPPLTLIASPEANATTEKIGVVSDVVYYWRVITKDAEGNTSDSGIFNFKAL